MECREPTLNFTTLCSTVMRLVGVDFLPLRTACLCVRRVNTTDMCPVLFSKSQSHRVSTFCVVQYSGARGEMQNMLRCTKDRSATQINNLSKLARKRPAVQMSSAPTKHQEHRKTIHDRTAYVRGVISHTIGTNCALKTFAGLQQERSQRIER